jgi:biotin carboxyl carrier protein
MENEILSDFKGKVKKILVKKGENVKKDQILLIGE